MITKTSKKILVADDSEFFRIKLSDILTEAGHRVLVVNDGMDVISDLKIGAESPDLLILDLQMPNVDGFGVLEWLRDNDMADRFPVLVITGVYEPTQILKRLKELHAKGLMTKSYGPEQIIHRVNQLLFPDRVERLTQRVPVSMPVDYAVGETAYHGYILNLSTNGMFLHTKNQMEPGTVVHVKFSLPDSDELLDVKGVVKWSTQTSGDENLFGGSGIELVFKDEGIRRAVKEFIEAELRRLQLY